MDALTGMYETVTEITERVTGNTGTASVRTASMLVIISPDARSDIAAQAVPIELRLSTMKVADIQEAENGAVLRPAVSADNQDMMLS